MRVPRIPQCPRTAFASHRSPCSAVQFTGRRYDPEEVVGEVLIGSDASCHLVVDLPSISPIHAKIWTDLDDCKVKDTSAPRGVYVNTERVEQEARIDEGDVLWLGPPQEPGSVCIKCHFKPWVEVLPGASARSEGEAAGPTPPPVEPSFDELPAADPAVDEFAPPEAPASPPSEPASGAGAAAEHARTAFASEPDAGASPSASEDDPFFVGEAEASEPASTPATAASEPVAQEPVSHQADEAHEEAAAANVEPEAEAVPAAVMDEWTIPEAPAEPEPRRRPWSTSSSSRASPTNPSHSPRSRLSSYPSRSQKWNGFGRAVPRPAAARAQLTADPHADARPGVRADACAGSEAQSGNGSEADTGARRRRSRTGTDAAPAAAPKEKPRPPRRRRSRSISRGPAAAPRAQPARRPAGIAPAARRPPAGVPPPPRGRAPPGCATWAWARPGCWSRAPSASAR